MPRFDMKEAQPVVQKKSRAAEEVDAMDGLRESGHSRRRMGKTTQIICRVTPEKRAQLFRLADLLSVGKPERISLTQTMEKALDVLEEKLGGGRT